MDAQANKARHANPARRFPSAGFRRFESLFCAQRTPTGRVGALCRWVFSRSVRALTFAAIAFAGVGCRHTVCERDTPIPAARPPAEISAPGEHQGLR